MSELGQRLRAAREARGLTLAQAEEATRIRRDYIEALEDEHYDFLPGAVYAKGFIRNYAAFLGLDPQACLAEYNAASARGTGTREGGVALPHVLDQPLLTASRRRRPVRSVLIGVLVLLVLAALGWYLYNRLYLGQDPWPLSMLTAPSTPTATPTQPVVTATVAPERTEAVEAPTQPAEPTPTHTPPPETATPAATPTRTRTAIPTATAAPPTPTPSPTLAEGFIVELRVNAVCYVRVVVDGAIVLEKNLAVGEDQRWEPKQSLTMRVGNAGGVVLAINGVDQPPLGAVNQAVDVTYTVDSLP